MKLSAPLRLLRVRNIERNHENDVLNALRSAEVFDSNYYRRFNKDLIEFTNEELELHYLNHGIFEQRLPCRHLRGFDLNNWQVRDIMSHPVLDDKGFLSSWLRGIEKIVISESIKTRSDYIIVGFTSGKIADITIQNVPPEEIKIFTLARTITESILQVPAFCARGFIIFVKKNQLDTPNKRRKIMLAGNDAVLELDKDSPLILEPDNIVKRLEKFFTDDYSGNPGIVSELASIIDFNYPYQNMSQNRIGEETYLYCYEPDEGSNLCKVDIIIPLFGQFDYMKLLLFNLCAGNYSNQVCVYFVIDDPVIETGFVEFISQYNSKISKLSLRVISLGGNYGFAAASNIGFLAGNSKYVLFLNSDILIGSDNWLTELEMELSRHSEAKAVGPLLLFPDGSIQHSGMELLTPPHHIRNDFQFLLHPSKGLPTSFARTKDSSEVSMLTGAAVFLLRSTFEEAGMWPYLFGKGDWEDGALSSILRKMGSLHIANEAVMFHLDGESHSTKGDMSIFRQGILRGLILSEKFQIWKKEKWHENQENSANYT